MFRVLVLTFIFWLCLNSSCCLAITDNPESRETAISSIVLNDAIYLDIEILSDSKNNYYLPFKSLCDVFEIEYKQNHVTKDITFVSNNIKGEISYKNQAVVLNNIKISLPILYIQKGIMDECKDELFLCPKFLGNIFDSEILIDKSELMVKITTDKNLAILQTSKEENLGSKKVLKAYTNVVEPCNKRTVTFDSIELSNNLRTDSFQELLVDEKQSTIFFNNSTRIALNGEAYKGKYAIDFSTYNNDGRAFSFGGLGFNYKNKYKNHDYEIGRVTGIGSNGAQVGADCYGLQLSKSTDEITSYKDIKGRVKTGSLIKVYANDELVKTLSTYNGHYSLKDVYLKDDPKKITLEEVEPNGNINVVLKQKFDTRAEIGSSSYSVLNAISGLNTRLWSDNGYIYEANAKKLLLGAQYEKVISDKLTTKTIFVKDNIISSSDGLWARDYINNAGFINFNTYKNTNTMQGQTLLKSYEYTPQDNLKIIANAGYSNSRDIQNANLNCSGLGFDTRVVFEKPNYNLSSKIFNYDSDYYLAGSSGMFLYDRRGLELNGGFNYKRFNLNSRISHYNSNLNNQMQNGKITFDELRLNSILPLTRKSALKTSYNGRFGKNDIGKLRNHYYDVNYNYRLNRNIRLNAGKQGSFYKTCYCHSNDYETSLSKYGTFYTKLGFDLLKKLGSMEISHDQVNMDSFSNTSKYNVARIGYNPPKIGKITCSGSTGYRYSGDNKGLDLSLTLGYEFDSGRVISINYMFNRNIGYMFDGIFMPTNSRHSINLNLNDVFAVVNDGLKSIGDNSQDCGLVQAITFLDVNQNGSHDKDEPAIEDIPVAFSFKNEPLYTNKKGKCKLQAVDEGIYNISVYEDDLPALLSLCPASKSNYKIKVDNNKKTEVEFGLISSVGNISGSVDVKDEFGREIPLKDLVIILIDDNNKEAAYTTVDEDFNFYISGIAPGKYKLQVDNDYMNLYEIFSNDNQGVKNITIPAVYDDYYDVKDIELKYIKYYNDQRL